MGEFCALRRLTGIFSVSTLFLCVHAKLAAMELTNVLLLGSQNDSDVSCVSFSIQVALSLDIFRHLVVV